jgi:hypothetical protein
MRLVKTLGALGLAGALTIAAAVPSKAGNEWAYAAGGLAVGTFLGAAAANANARAYYGPGYAYEPYYAAPAYTYAPAPAYSYGYSEPAYVDSYAYAPTYRTYVAPRRAYGCYNRKDCMSNRERQLNGTD